MLYAIPSKMSCSLATTAGMPARSMITRSTSAPAAITSARPGCMIGTSSRPAKGIASRSFVTFATSSYDTRAWWIRAGSYSRRSSAMPTTVVTEPASPTSVAGVDGHRRGWPRRGGAGHELGRAAADVHDQVRRRGVQPAHGAGVRQPRLLVARHDLRIGAERGPYHR